MMELGKKIKQLRFKAGLTQEQLAEKLGIGAQAVSDALALELKDFRSGLKISSACPVVDDFICKYMPDFTPCITKVLSPALFCFISPPRR